MRNLSPRRFPDIITRRRQAPGAYNSAGEYVEGAVTETELWASVQPLSAEDVDAVEGARLSDRLKVYVPEPDALVAAFVDREADHVVWLGQNFTVIESRSWPGSHTRATILRET
ncbi:MAG: hypothetical protein OXC14_14100 [Rhodospirillaceae bacterium]|nr:hypothetical protein [Rhodospirillaceae bacterium]